MISILIQCIIGTVFASDAFAEPCDAFLESACTNNVVTIPDPCHATRAYITTHQKPTPFVFILNAFTEGFGNLLQDLHSCYLAADYLGLTFYVDFASFPEFSVLLEPRNMNLSLPHGHDFLNDRPHGSLLFEFFDGFIVGSPSHLRHISSLLPHSTAHGQSIRPLCHAIEDQLSPLYPQKFSSAGCFLWTFFRPTTLAEEQVTATLGTRAVDPTVWHIRTPEGEPSEYNFHVSQFHVLIDEIPVLCQAYHQATRHLPVNDLAYVTGNSLKFRTQCSGIKPPGDYLKGLTGLHTQTNNARHSRIAAIIDFLLLVRAKYIIHSGSSLAEHAMSFANYDCFPSSASTALIRGTITVCTMRSLIMFQGAAVVSEFRPSDYPLLPLTPEAISCVDPLWCGYFHTQFQIIERWQSQDCNSARLMVYDPQTHSIWTMLHMVGIALRAAMCHKRVLVLDPHGNSFWRPTSVGCHLNPLECYFQPISSCKMRKIWTKAPIMTESNVNERVNDRVVRVMGHIANDCGPCNANGSFPQEGLPSLHGLTGRNLTHALHLIEATLMAATMRYIMRPQMWLQSSIHYVTQGLPKIPRPFASVHVHHIPGLTSEELGIQLREYLDTLLLTNPHIRSIFISTETKQVFHQLSDGYPGITFYALRDDEEGTQWRKGSAAENAFIYSIANLHIAIHADAFVGNLSSQWCHLIMEMEHTRGDAGVEYINVGAHDGAVVCPDQ